MSGSDVHALRSTVSLLASHALCASSAVLVRLKLLQVRSMHASVRWPCDGCVPVGLPVARLGQVRTLRAVHSSRPRYARASVREHQRQEVQTVIHLLTRACLEWRKSGPNHRVHMTTLVARIDTSVFSIARPRARPRPHPFDSGHPPHMLCEQRYRLIKGSCG